MKTTRYIIYNNISFIKDFKIEKKNSDAVIARNLFFESPCLENYISNMYCQHQLPNCDSVFYKNKYFEFRQINFIFLISLFQMFGKIFSSYLDNVKMQAQKILKLFPLQLQKMKIMNFQCCEFNKIINSCHILEAQANRIKTIFLNIIYGDKILSVPNFRRFRY